MQKIHETISDSGKQKYKRCLIDGANTKDEDESNIQRKHKTTNTGYICAVMRSCTNYFRVRSSPNPLESDPEESNFAENILHSILQRIYSCECSADNKVVGDEAFSRNFWSGWRSLRLYSKPTRRQVLKWRSVRDLVSANLGWATYTQIISQHILCRIRSSGLPVTKSHRFT